MHDIGKLLFFFNSLSYYLPVESKSGTTRFQGPLGDLCTGYVPAPLGNDLNRFNALLREMESGRAGDLVRLFSSARSPLTTEQMRDREESSSGTVFTALQKGNVHKGDTLHRERLWQARLVLKLAETLIRRENEIRQGLAQIASAENKVIALLEGQDETADDSVLSQEPDNSAGWSRKTNYPVELSRGSSTLLAPVIAKAWAELFLTDPSPDKPFILAATNPDSAGIILDGYERIQRKPPLKLFSLLVPEPHGLEPDNATFEEYLRGRVTLRRAAEEILVYIGESLSDIPAQKGPAYIEQKHINTWDEAVKNEFAGPGVGHSKLDFFLLPEIQPENLFRRIFSLEPAEKDKEQLPTASLLAILR